MDFDEYEYLEKTVESVDLSKGSNGTNVKSRSAEKRRTGEGDDDEGYNSKRHRSADGDKGKSDDRDRSNSERSKDRGERDKDRDRDRDRERNRERERSDREKSDRSHRDRDKDRDAERERDREHRDRDKDRERERDRDRERDYKDGERRRHSKDRDRDRERDYDRERERERRSKDRSHSRSRDYDREASRSRDIERDRYSREKREKKEEAAAEPEADPERDQRTVFAFQISLKASEKDVYEFFSRAGKVRDVKLIMDRNTRRSKGVGYIEFYDAMAVPMAIALTGQLLLGQPVMVKPSEAEKNLVQSTSTATTGAGGMMGPYSGSARRLYVGNLHTNITEAQLKQVFEPFGTIELVQLPLEPETGRCKGYGFVQYSRLEDARTAQQELNGVLELAGRVIKVTPMTEQMSIQDATVAPGELDDDDGGGVSLTARSRALLMQKLDRSGTVSSIVSSAAPSLLPGAGVSVPPALPGLGIPGMVGLPNPAMGAGASLGGGIELIGPPTDCLLLKNMFDPATETEPDFDLDIKDEVQSECSKYGAVKHIFVDKNSAGHVYLRFNNLASAVSAQKALHGRWFAGKMITTSFMTPQAYEAKFPQSR